MDRLEKIVELIQEEAREKPGAQSYVSKLHGVLMDVVLEVLGITKALRDQEREKAKKEGGG